MTRPRVEDRFERVEVTSRAAWRQWIEANHERRESIWLVTYKKVAGERHVPYREVVEEALCFGWIDSRPAKLDAERSMLLLSPRRIGSAWSRINKQRVTELLQSGRMHAAGLAKIEQAKADGSWEALDAVEAEQLPPDLVEALKQMPEAARQFAALPPSLRRGLLDRIRVAKRPETRAKRIQETVAQAARKERTGERLRPVEVTKS